MITMDKKYRTKTGHAVTLYCVDAPGSMPVHGRYEGADYAASWDAQGRAPYSESAKGAFDLIEVQPEAWQVYLWRERLGTYSLLSLACTYPSYSAARAAHPDAAVIVKVPG